MGPLIPLITTGLGGLFSWLGGRSKGNAAKQAADTSSQGVPLTPLITTGLGGLFRLLGARSSGNATKQAADTSYQGVLAQLAQAQRELDEQRRQFDESQAAARAALEAENEMRRRELAATEEERAFQRGLLEERQARRRMFYPLQEQAWGSLGGLLRMR